MDYYLKSLEMFLQATQEIFLLQHAVQSTSVKI